MSKELPPNMLVVWHRGSRSVVDAFYNDIKNGFANGKMHPIFAEYAPYGKQLSEETFKKAFDMTVSFAIAHLGIANVHYRRQDLEDKVGENSNNEPFRLGKIKTIKIYGYEQKKGI